MPNTFGHIFRVSTFGESHGSGLGAIVDGCPAGIPISIETIQKALDRRKPGQSAWTTQRKEGDRVECLSGLEDGVTLGSPLSLLIRNEDKRPQDYTGVENIFRPSHGDYTTQMKYGIRSKSGGGRLSARETVARVAAAAVAEQILGKLLPELCVVAYVSSIKDLDAEIPETPDFLCRTKVDEDPLRCPDPKILPKMKSLLQESLESGDTVGGVITCLVFNCPAGLGEPVFDKLHADFGKALLSLPAARAFEVGSGFASCRLRGSENNDAFVNTEQGIRTLTNNSGGIQGGISNGESIKLRVGFKAPSTIFKAQQTVDIHGRNLNFHLKQGRHDPCVLPRAVPIVEAMVSLVLLDHFLRQKTVRLS